MVTPPGPGKGKEINRRRGFPATLFLRVSEAIENPEKMTPAMKKFIEYSELEYQRIQEQLDLPMLPDENLKARTRELLYRPKLSPFLGPKPNPIKKPSTSLQDQYARLSKYVNLKPLPSAEEFMSPLHKKIRQKLKELALAKTNVAPKGASEDVIAPTKEKQLATGGTEIPDDVLNKVTVEDMETCMLDEKSSIDERLPSSCHCTYLN